MKRSKEIFVFGGAYSNFQATQKLRYIAQNLGFSPNHIVCTGDVVGYCGQPQETIDLIRDWGVHVIAGNVELQLAEDKDDCGCNFEEGSRCANFSQTWFPYAQIHVNQESKDWMRALPTSAKIDFDGIAVGVVHGGIENVSEFIFKSTPQQAKKRVFETLGVDIVLAGHSGLPFHQKFGEDLWVNAGVIGMPANDGENEVWYAIVDLETKKVEHLSFEYDWQLAKTQMLQNKLPASYANTLETGLWDNMEILPDHERSFKGRKMQEYFNSEKNI